MQITHRSCDQTKKILLKFWWAYRTRWYLTLRGKQVTYRSSPTIRDKDISKWIWKNYDNETFCSSFKNSDVLARYSRNREFFKTHRERSHRKFDQKSQISTSKRISIILEIVKITVNIKIKKESMKVKLTSRSSKIDTLDFRTNF